MDFSKYFQIWGKLSADHKAVLSSSAREVKFSKGELIHTANDCIGLILITSGQLRAYASSEDGREITLYRLFEHDICLFSASCIMKSIQFDINISAEKDTEAILFSADTYKRIMQESAHLANYTNEIMASRFSDVMWIIEQIMWKSFDKRLAEFLINESNIEESETLKITHEEIGNHMGNPREVVTRMLKYFADEGLVKLSRGKIELCNIKRLERLAT